METLPYPEPGGDEWTGGWSGSEASHDRALTEARDGITARRQRQALALLTQRGPEGITWWELAQATDMHHGGASGVLSNLDKAHQVVRLAERRGRSHVYVLPEHARGRELGQARKKVCPHCGMPL